MTTMPVHVYQQRETALRRANEIRAACARAKKRIHEAGRSGGAMEAAAILANPSEEVGVMRVEDLLAAVPTIGRLSAPRGGKGPGGGLQKGWLKEFRILPTTRIGLIPPGKRAELVERLRLYADPAAYTRFMERQR